MLYDIVIIEDEIDLGNVISEYLKLRGFSVLWFKAAAEALDYYQSNQLGNKLIIVDIQLPDMNGFDLASQIVKINPNQPFFFLTAHNEKQDRLRGLTIGAIDYISKPFEIEELVLRIGNIINKFTNSPQRPAGSRSGLIHIGDIKYQKDQLFVLMPNNKEVSLTVRESEVLDQLAEISIGWLRKRICCSHSGETMIILMEKALKFLFQGLEGFLRPPGKLVLKTYTG